MLVGTEEIAYAPEVKADLDIEVLLREVPVFLLVFLYAFGVIGAAPFFVLFYLAYARYFIANHDRFHCSTSRRLPRTIEVIAETLALCTVPWTEPYDSIRTKHMRHHYTHRPGRKPVLDTRDDPHSAYEMGGFLRAFLSSLFYEEVQLYLDIRDSKVTKSRWVNLILYLPLQIIFFLSFGWQVYLGVFLAVRLTGAISWFMFSWAIHQPYVYRFGFAHVAPAPLGWFIGLTNGRRTMVGVLHHVSHHAWPNVPYWYLEQFDAAVLRQPGAVLEMYHSGA